MNPGTVILIYLLLVDAQTVCTAVSSATQSSSFRSGGQNEGLNTTAFQQKTVRTRLHFEKFPLKSHLFIDLSTNLLLILSTAVTEILL